MTVKGEPITRTSDGNGGFTETYSSLGQVWAAVEPATASDVERRAQTQVQGQITHFVEMPYIAGVTVTAIVEFGTRVLRVKGIQNWQERDISLLLACEERV